VLLVTYLPFNRIHEVEEYFMRNVQLIGPSEAMAYVDNVFRDEQRDILGRVLSDAGVEVRTGNWRSRDMTWFQMLADLQGSEDLLFVDSDSVADEHFHEIHRQMEAHGMYGLLDREGWVRGGGTGNAFARYSRLLGYISIDGGRRRRPFYEHRTYNPSPLHKGSVFFIGPKQLVFFRRAPDGDLVDRVRRAFLNVPSPLRQSVSDETILGLIAYLSGFRGVPWTIGSRHYHHGSGPEGSPVDEALAASAHLHFAKGLRREFGPRREFLAYELKYTLSLMRNAPRMF